MKEELRKLIDRLYSTLVQTIDVEHGLLGDLLSCDVINGEHMESIKGQSTHTKKNETLLDILKRRDDECFIDFVKVLKKRQYDLARLIVQPTPVQEFQGDGEVQTSRGPLIRQSNVNDSLMQSLAPAEELRLRRIVSKTQEENNSLLLEKEILRLNSLVKDLETKLKAAESKNDRDEQKIQNLENSLSEMTLEQDKLEKNVSRLQQDYNSCKDECQLLTKQLKQTGEEIIVFKRDFCTKTKRIEDLETHLDMKTKEKRKTELKLHELEEKYPRFLEEIHQKGKNIPIIGGGVVMGVALLNMRIYIVCLKTMKLFVFKDEPPFEQMYSEEFEIADLKNPRDIASSEKDKSLFISDERGSEEHKIFQLQIYTSNHLLTRSNSHIDGYNSRKMHMPKQKSVDEILDMPSQNMFKTSSWSINRKPQKLFVCTSENQAGTILVVLASSFDKSGDEYFVYIYKVAEKKLMKKVLLSPELGEVHQVIVQPYLLKTSGSINNEFSLCDSPGESSFNATFIVSHKSTETDPDGMVKSVWLVSKLSSDGTAILHSFNPSVIDGININRPEYMGLVENCRVIIADQENNRVVILGPKLQGGQVLIKKDNMHEIEKPTRVVYNRLKKMIVVSHWAPKGKFSVFTH